MPSIYLLRCAPLNASGRLRLLHIPHNISCSHSRLLYVPQNASR